jgi:MOSC domain-containing protein YiiM
MKLIGIQVAKPHLRGTPDAADPNDRQWTTGFFKETVRGSVLASRTNLDGDGQADLKAHGGPDKAICVYPKDHWSFWAEELSLTVMPGAFGENFTTLGAVEADVCIGDVFRCGAAIFQISQPRQPCWKLARRWRIRDLAARVERTGRTGWYFRVLEEGVVEAGADFALVERQHPEWTIAAANDVMHHRKTDWEAANRLAFCPALSQSWKSSLSRRAATQQIASTAARLEGGG